MASPIPGLEQSSATFSRFLDGGVIGSVRGSVATLSLPVGFTAPHLPPASQLMDDQTRQHVGEKKNIGSVRFPNLTHIAIPLTLTSRLFLPPLITLLFCSHSVYSLHLSLAQSSLTTSLLHRHHSSLCLNPPLRLFHPLSLSIYPSRVYLSTIYLSFWPDVRCNLSSVRTESFHWCTGNPVITVREIHDTKQPVIWKWVLASCSRLLSVGWTLRS